jgi:hypothetical protein
MPWNTPSAVEGAELPEPPAASVLPNTVVHRRPITSMSCDVVFMSHAVQYVPCSDSTRSAYRRSSRSRAAPVGTSGTATTALPPPSGRPATAFFRVIALERRSPSRSASAGDG